MTDSILKVFTFFVLLFIMSTQTRAQEEVINNLTDENWMVRREAVLELKDYKDEFDITSLLEDRLDDEESRVRAAAVRELGFLGSDTEEVIIKALDDETPEVLENTVKALGRIKSDSEDVLTRLNELLLHQNTDVKSAVLDTFREIGPGLNGNLSKKITVSNILLQLGDLDTGLVFNAQRTLNVLYLEPSLLDLEKLLTDEDKETRYKAFRAVNRFDIKEKDISTVIDLLNHNNPEIRWQTLNILEWQIENIEIEVDKLIEIILKLMEDEMWYVKSQAVAVFKNFSSTSKKAIPLLIEATDSDNEIIRWAAVRGIRAIGINSKDVEEALVQKLNDDSSKVRNIAARALEAINYEKFSAKKVKETKIYEMVIHRLDEYVPDFMKAQNITESEMADYLMWSKKAIRSEVEDESSEAENIVEQDNKIHGGFRNTNNMRMQEVTYTLAFLYQEPESKYYQNKHVLNRILWSLDYLTRAQGSNGGFNEFEEHGWCGVPNRSQGKTSVGGFTLYAMGRTIELLWEDSAFKEAINNENIDTKGLGKPHINRRKGWLNMFKKAVEWQVERHGHSTNQEACNIVGAYAVNEAYKLLNSENKPAVAEAKLDQRTEKGLSTSWNNGFQFWTEKGMIIEGGGYDANYGYVTINFLALLTHYNKKAEDRLKKFGNVFQYFLFPTKREGYTTTFKYYTENRTSSRGPGKSNPPKLNVVGLAQEYHPALKVIYKPALETFLEGSNNSWPGTGSAHSFQHSLYTWVDFVEFARLPVDSDYILPAESEETFTFFDRESSALAVKTQEDFLLYAQLEHDKYHVVGEDYGGGLDLDKEKSAGELIDIILKEVNLE